MDPVPDTSLGYVVGYSRVGRVRYFADETSSSLVLEGSTVPLTFYRGRRKRQRPNET